MKTQFAAEPSAPPADAQRLLFKGKALADGKLLKEYNNIKDYQFDGETWIRLEHYSNNDSTITTSICIAYARVPGWAPIRP